MVSEGIEIQVGKILDEYTRLSGEVVEKASRKAARNAVQKLRNTSPRRSGEYASGWASKKQGHGFVVYNRKKPQLTHLLEKGHTLRNKFGTYGRAPAIVHIAPVEKEANQEFEENVRRELSR